VLSETATRALCYVAMTRGRQAKGTYLCQRSPEHDHPTTPHDLAADAAGDALPARVHGAIDHRAATLHHRALEYECWRTASTLGRSLLEAPSRSVGFEYLTTKGLSSGNTLYLPASLYHSAITSMRRGRCVSARLTV
jgi:hypothetical protein